MSEMIDFKDLVLKTIDEKMNYERDIWVNKDRCISTAKLELLCGSVSSFTELKNGRLELLSGKASDHITEIIYKSFKKIRPVVSAKSSIVMEMISDLSKKLKVPIKLVTLDVLKRFDKIPNYNDVIEYENVSTKPFICVSHCWESKDEPDPYRTQLKFIFNQIKDNQLIFIDYSSIPQKPRDEVQEFIFKLCLDSMFYFYKENTILRIPHNEYFMRSWCLFESFCYSLGDFTKQVINNDFKIEQESLLIFDRLQSYREKLVKDRVDQLLGVDIEDSEGNYLETVDIIKVLISRSKVTNGSDKESIIKQITDSSIEISKIEIRNYVMILLI